MTLTEAASFTRRALKIFGISVGLIFVGWIIIRLINPSLNVPADYLEPNNMCGVVEELSLTSLEIDTPSTNFDIETASGAIPKIAEVVNVYKYTNPGHLPWSLEQAQMKAEDLDFSPEGYTRTGSTEYKWTNSENSQTLIVDTSSQNFTLTTDFQGSNIDTYSQYLPTETDAKEFSLNYLTQLGLLTNDYKDGYQEVIPIKILPNGEFREEESIADADLVRVDFFRFKDIITIESESESIGGLGSTLQEQLEDQDAQYMETADGEEIEVKTYATKVLNNNPALGNISVYVGGHKSGTRSIAFGISYINWIIGDTPCGTYSLISPQAAVKKVQDGEGHLVYLMEEDGDRLAPYEESSISEITVYNVELAYLDLAIEQNYLQPIYSVTGEAKLSNGTYEDFYYYVPAIDYSAIPDNAGQTTTTDQ